MEQLYETYAKAMKKIYGEKVYKIPINIPVTCPNRDGTKGVDGCIFCGAKGTGFENLPNEWTVTKQLERNMEYIGKKYKAEKFAAYFQNFTNTYLPLHQLEQYTNQAASVPEVVEICFATRPDCVSDECLKAIKNAAGGKQVCIELGLQSASNATLLKINRGHTVEEFINGAKRVKQYGFTVCVHFILNLPWDGDEEAIQGAKLVSELDVDFVKLHSLYIEKQTKLCSMYLNHEFEMIDCSAYAYRVALFLAHLKPGIALQRIAGRAPEEDTVFCNWGMSWWKVKDAIEETMRKENLFQGKLYEVEK